MYVHACTLWEVHCLRVGGFNSKFLVKLFVIYQLETTEPVYGNHMVSPSSSTDMTDQIWLSNTGESVRKSRRESSHHNTEYRIKLESFSAFCAMTSL